MATWTSSNKELLEFVEKQHEALLHQLSVTFRQNLCSSGSNAENECCLDGFTPAMTAQPFVGGDVDFLATEQSTQTGAPPKLDANLASAEPSIKDDEHAPSPFSSDWNESVAKTSTSTKSKQMLKLLTADEPGDKEPRGWCPWLRPYMDAITWTLVLSNAATLIVEAQIEGDMLGDLLRAGGDMTSYVDPSVFVGLGFTFDLLFLVELVLVLVMGPNSDSLFNLEGCGMCLVALVSASEIVMLACLWSGIYVSPQTFHIVHAVTCFRGFRCLGPLRSFQGPQLLIRACRSFMHSLFWAVVFLSVFMLTSALALANFLFTFYKSAASVDDKMWVWERYGTTFRSLYTLYEITFSGSWPSSTRPVIEKVHAALVLFFVMYITIVAFGLIRVITAVFLRDTLDAAASDAEQQVVESLKKKEAYAERLEEIFSAIDVAGSGTLTEQQLVDALSAPKIAAYFQTLELDIHESKALFHILDDGDGTVTLKEFIVGLLRCKGPARAIDQVAAQAELKHLERQMNTIIAMLDLPALESNAKFASTTTGADAKLKPVFAATTSAPSTPSRCTGGQISAHLAVFTQTPSRV